jgi:alkylhydroperoxidase family enzyme
MAFIDTISASWVTGEAFAMYDRQQKHYGYVPNYATVFSHRPDVMRRWGELLAAIKKPMGRRRFELATFAAAHELRSTLCTLAHGKELLAYFSAEDVLALGRGEAPPSLSAAEAALMRFARVVARDASSVKADDVAALSGMAFRTPRSSTSRRPRPGARSLRRSSSRSASWPTRPCASSMPGSEQR